MLPWHVKRRNPVSLFILKADNMSHMPSRCEFWGDLYPFIPKQNHLTITLFYHLRCDIQRNSPLVTHLDFSTANVLLRNFVLLIYENLWFKCLNPLILLINIWKIGFVFRVLKRKFDVFFCKFGFACVINSLRLIDKLNPWF